MLELTGKNYHAAITENFPQLPIETWEPLYEGWANRTFLVNQRIVFRFPKHQVAARDLVREIRLLTDVPPHFRIYSIFSNITSKKKWRQS